MARTGNGPQSSLVETDLSDFGFRVVQVEEEGDDVGVDLLEKR